MYLIPHRTQNSLAAQEEPLRDNPSSPVQRTPGPSVAGILLTGLVYGRAGLRDLFSSLRKWRVSLRWYTVAILTAPLFDMAED